MEGRSKCSEEPVDGAVEEGVGQLLERLQVRNAEVESASASNDWHRSYSAPGLPLKWDDVSNSARDAEPLAADSSSWEAQIKVLLQEGPQHSQGAASSRSVANGRLSHEYDHVQRSMDFSGRPSTAGVREEEEWEAVVNELPVPEKPSSQTVRKELHSNRKSAVKQRGRGSFTYGGMGMYSDNLELNADMNGPESRCSPSDYSVDSDPSHTLVLDCTSKVSTKDVEEIVMPFSKEGSCAVRRVDYSRVLAVFSTPTMAREALLGINDGRFKVSMADETDVIAGKQSSVNDMAQSVPRPASSAKVAQRMIASALSRKGLSKQLLAKSQGSAQDLQKQERERKLRLQKRAQLRDEAWGSDDD